MSAALSDVRSIAGAKARIRIDQQRESFDRLAAAIAKAGHKQAAREFRAEAERAMARAIEFEEERIAREEDRATLNLIRAALDGVLPDAMRDGRRLTDDERVVWIIRAWKDVSRELATTERAEP